MGCGYVVQANTKFVIAGQVFFRKCKGNCKEMMERICQALRRSEIQDGNRNDKVKY